jgi:N-dimethylarginine dimethylaminohydrolase
MARAFLMSPPPARWRIRGGANYKSVRRDSVSPRRALREWLSLADAIEAHGGVVSVVPPPADPPEPLTGLMYTANAGWLRTGDRFRLARLSVAHRQEERGYLREALTKLFGWEIEESRSLWEGQADMCKLSGSVILLSYGVRSSRESVDEVAELLPSGQRYGAVRLREPFFHGDTCMDVLAGSNPTFLVFPGAFATPDEYRVVKKMASGEAELLEISEADALGYACNTLGLGEVLLVPSGLSAELQRSLVQRGYRLVELDFSELFGKGGGGPRCLVNEIETPGEPRSQYSGLRDSLYEQVESYPDAEVS